MAWVVTPPTQTQVSKTGWVTSPATTTTTPGQGWVGSGSITIMWGPRGDGQLAVTTMARPSKPALLAGQGALSATVLKREYRTAALSGLGTLAAPYSQIHPAAPLFNGVGSLSGNTVSTHQEANFNGEGALYGYWDGLTASVGIGYGIDGPFSGEGILVPSLESIYVIFKEFAGEGTLTGPLVPKLVANLAGNGALLASAYARYSRAAALLASGTLSATDFAAYLRSAGLAGAGVLTNLLQILYTPAAGGTGTVSATVMQKYANAPALSGGGTLSASAFGGMLPSLSGAGALSATRFPVYPRAVGVSGVGALTGAGFPRYARGFGDDFNRPDSTTSPGPGWTNRFNVIGISGNAAYAENSQTNWCIATPDTPMAGDDGEASIVVGPANASENMFVGLGLNAAGEGAFYYCNGSSHYIFNQVTWAVNWANQASEPGATITTGDRMTIRRVGNTYFGLLNGVIQVAWADSGNLIPRDANHRLYEIGLYPGTRIVDSFQANEIGVLSGSGTVAGQTMQIYPIKTGFGDGFNRADDFSGIGNGWVARAGVMGVYGNGVVPVAANQWNESSAPVIMNSDDMEVSFTLGVQFGAGFDYTTILLGCNESGEGMFIFFNGAAGVTIYTQTGWGAAGLAAQASIGIGQVDGDKWTVRRVGNLYTILKNGSPIGLTWTDSTNIIPRDANHRQVGVGAYTDGTNARTIDNFTATDNGSLTSDGVLLASVMKKEFRTSSLSGGGTLSATVIGFVPFSETNTARTNQAVPAGCGGCWVTLIGGGGGGGCGGTNQGSGGAGGGGAGKVGRSYIARASLGATYSVGIGTGGAKGLASNNSDGTAGTASTFSSGGVSWSAGGGGAGAKGGTGSSSTAGAGGTCSTTGVAGTINNGTAGGAGTGGAGSAGPNNANGAAAGGGAGGKGTVFGSNAGGKGGNSSTITGGNGGNPGATPSNASAGNGGGGGGGGTENGTGGAAGDAGNGGGYGGGGGGGGGTNNLASGAQGDGGTGAGAYTLVEWVGA